MEVFSRQNVEEAITVEESMQTHRKQYDFFFSSINQEYKTQRELSLPGTIAASLVI